MSIMLIYLLKNKVLIVFASCLLMVNMSTNAQCNGFEELCAKSYQQIAYLTSHNAFASSEDGFYFPNQNLNIPNQLNMGVRALMLDIYDVDGELFLYHSVTELGSTELNIVLNQIKDFLINHSNEVITLILEDYSTSIALSNAFEISGLSAYLFEYSDINAWPTLQEMIDSNKRLVVFTDNDDENAPSSHHFLWSHAVETHYDNMSATNFSCDYNRGDEENDLFIFNHFINNYLLYATNPEAYLSEVQLINSYEFLSNRVMECISLTNKFPNFITVDFVDYGEAHQLVNELNDLPETNVNETKYAFHIFPNPSNGKVFVETHQSVKHKSIKMINVMGNDITPKIKISTINSLLSLDISDLKNGLYFLQINNFNTRILKQ